MKLKKKNSTTIQKQRFYIQLSFSFLCIWIGVEFYLFINSLHNPLITGELYRPPGVEAFLPISSLMNLMHWIYSGTIHSYHPAGFFILIAIILMSFFIGKSFCSWFCPIGFLSELVADFGEKISIKLFNRRIKLIMFIDYPLRSIKYLFLLFFVNVIFFSMNETALKIFLDGNYNLMSDIKMYYFFANISPFAFTTISILFFLSIIFRNFWCRYLCPYGALLGILGLLSPLKIKRNESLCIDCTKCAKVCPSFIKVDKIKTVISDECVSCYQCIDACPVNNTLKISIPLSENQLMKKIVPIFLIVLFLVVTGIGIFTDNWQNKVETDHYRKLIKNVESLDHPTSSRDIKKLQKRANTNYSPINK